MANLHIRNSVHMANLHIRNSVHRNSAHLPWPVSIRHFDQLRCQGFGNSTDRADQRNYGFVLHAISSGCPIVL